jgi:hypothetical protein
MTYVTVLEKKEPKTKKYETIFLCKDCQVARRIVETSNKDVVWEEFQDVFYGHINGVETYRVGLCRVQE